MDHVSALGDRLDRAQVIGSELTFSARDEVANVFELYSWDGLSATLLAELPAGNNNFQAVNDWSPPRSLERTGGAELITRSCS